jgi:hypothetical protein
MLFDYSIGRYSAIIEGPEAHFPSEILGKSQSQLDFYYKSQSELLKSQSIKKRYLSVE